MKFLMKVILFICFIYVFLLLNNEWIKTTSYEYTADNIPEAFNGYKITQITDLHDAELGDNHKNLIKKVKATNPDIIVFTGDVIDSRRYKLKQSIDAMKQLTEIAPVYYVQGNHEVATNAMDIIYEALEKVGVHTLKNEHVELTYKGEKVAIAGVEDALMGIPTEQMIRQATKSIPKDEFTVLLSHRPEKFDTYVDESVQLVLTGHAHGGQIRIPFVGGLVAPSQGLFPEYTSGIYEEGSTTMIVNRGLGNSLFPFRIFNRPEVIEITLKAK